jgi:hypothetical protein
MRGQVRKNGGGSAGPIFVFVRMRGEVRKSGGGSAGLIFVFVHMRGHVRKNGVGIAGPKMPPGKVASNKKQIRRDRSMQAFCS